MIIYNIYKSTNKINNKVYIGFTKNFIKRIKNHKRCCDVYDKNNDFRVFYSAIKKYGWENFEWEIIYQSKNLDHTKNVMENYFIKEYKSFVGFKGCNGYNMSLGGEGTHGRKCSEQTKAKIRNSVKKYFEIQENREKNSKSVKISFEGRFTAKNSITGEMVGLVDKTHENVISGIWVPVMVGYKHSEETKKKMSSSKMGHKSYKRTEENIQNLKNSRIGKGIGERNSMSKEENRIKVSQSKKGRKKYINIETKESKYCFPGTEPEGFILKSSIK